MTGGTGTQKLAAITSMVVGALSGLVTGAALGSWSGEPLGGCCFGGFGFSLGLLAGCVAAAVFARVVRPREPGGPEADYDDEPAG